MRTITQLLLILTHVSLIACFGQVPQESAPSKDETIRFLKEKMEGVNVSSTYSSESGHGGFFTHFYGGIFTSLEGSCNLVIKASQRTVDDVVVIPGGEQKTEHVYVWEASLDLSKVSLGQVKSAEYYPHAEIKQATEQGGFNVTSQGNPVFQVAIPAVQRDAFRVVTTIDGNRQDPVQSNLLIAAYFPDAETAERVAKAITHLADLCGATKEPF